MSMKNICFILMVYCCEIYRYCRLGIHDTVLNPLLRQFQNLVGLIVNAGKCNRRYNLSRFG